MPPDTSVVVGVCAVVHQRDKTLMIKRTGTQSYADGHNTWGLPGGWLEYGEEPWDAAAREVMEETGVDVVPVGDRGWIVSKSDDGERWILTMYVECTYLSGEPTVTEPDKCAEVGFVDPLDGRPLFVQVTEWIDKYGLKL
jgi:8-oxo-dGTP diphosphatase